MGFLETLISLTLTPLDALNMLSTEGPVTGPIIGPIVDPDTGETVYPPNVSDTTDLQVKQARNHLLIMMGILGAGAIAPVAYAAYLNSGKRKKKKLTPAEERMGIALENAGVQWTNTVMTMAASPAVALPLGYIGVQKLEDSKIITKGLGNAVQTLMTVAVAAPLIQMATSVGTSAFKKGK